MGHVKEMPKGTFLALSASIKSLQSVLLSSHFKKLEKEKENKVS